MRMTREELAKGMLEMKKMAERMQTDPEYRAKVEQERKEFEERAEHREKQPRRVSVRKETIKRIQDFYWHTARHLDDDGLGLIRRMDKMGKQGKGESIDDAINFILDEFEKACEYSKW
jgi:predicted RNase H-like nuclease (RuvC/YqgF family)